MKKASVFFIAFAIIAGSRAALHGQAARMSPEETKKSRAALVAYSKQFIGCPYQLGAIGPDAFDCSGLIFTCAREAIGQQLPRKTTAMFSFCSDVADGEIEAGDLVFFKTTASNEVSHVGIYLGNSQFIHAASDGPNTGVIISSLRESYWKSHYYTAKRFLPASRQNESLSQPQAAAEPLEAKEPPVKKNPQPKAQRTAAPKKRPGNSFLPTVIVDASFFLDWNFFTSKNVRLNFRGISSLIHARSIGENWQPGLGMIIRYDSGTGVFQLPLIASLSFGDHVRFYTGPVISFGSPSLPGDSTSDIKASFFPGIMGICWQTPPLFTGKKLSFALVQDIHYTVFNRTNGAALSPVDSIASGLVFSTGLRFSLPLRNIL